MSKKLCVYCNIKNKLSREHIISKVVLKELFTDKINNVVSVRKNNQWKRLTKYEGVIKDVCVKCNTKLSDLGYDDAGAKFIKNIDANHSNKTINLDFNREILGWIIKTHLNLIRAEKNIKGEAIVINENLFKGIIEKNIDYNWFGLMVRAMDIGPKKWISEKGIIPVLFNEVGIINEKNIMFSHLRIKYLDTFLILPKNGEYEFFKNDNMEQAFIAINVLGNPFSILVDTDKLVKDGALVMDRKFSEERFDAGLMKVENYEKLFK